MSAVNKYDEQEVQEIPVDSFSERIDHDVSLSSITNAHFSKPAAPVTPINSNQDFNEPKVARSSP